MTYKILQYTHPQTSNISWTLDRQSMTIIKKTPMQNQCTFTRQVLTMYIELCYAFGKPKPPRSRKNQRQRGRWCTKFKSKAHTETAALVGRPICINLYSYVRNIITQKRACGPRPNWFTRFERCSRSARGCRYFRRKTQT